MSLLSLVFPLFFLAHTFAQQTTCPKCGSMEIPYPLSTAPDCGLPAYSLSCTNHTLTFLSADNFPYTVLSISPATSRLIIQPPSILKDTCQSSDLGLNGLSIDDGSPFNISKVNTVMLFNCSDNLLLSPLNCSSTSQCRLFEEHTAQAAGCRDALCCSYLKDASMTSRRIRVRVGGCTAYTSVVDFKEGQGVDEWNYGIELQWLPPPS